MTEPITKEEMLRFRDRVDRYLRSGDGDWDITSHPDPEVEGALLAIRDLIESSGEQASSIEGYPESVKRVLKPAPPTPPANMIGWLDRTVKKLTDEGIVPEGELMVATEIRNLILQPKATVTREQIKKWKEAFYGCPSHHEINNLLFGILRDIGIAVTDEEGK